MQPRHVKSILALAIALALIAGPLAGLGRAQSDDVEALVTGNNVFAFDLFRAVRSDQNTIFSPYSISTALAMTYAGARGDTARQMADTLHFTLPQGQLHPAFAALAAALVPPPVDESLPPEMQEGEPLQLNIANALWGQQDYGFLQDYLDLVAAYYGGGLREVDFAADPEQARETINHWISEQTQERIQNLLGPQSIDTLTRLVLTNAIYFKASWRLPFEPEATQDGPFTLLNGSQVSVPMMAQTESFGYLAGDGFQAVALPYAGGTASMLIVVPDAGTFGAFTESLDADRFAAILDNIQSASVMLTLPRFTFESEFGLADTLAALGMPDAFTGQADFSGMTGTPDLYISAVIHKAFIGVDEAGTEAAAATAVIMALTAMPQVPVELRIDRPFVFAIYDTATRAILFLGSVTNPAG